MSKPEPIVKCLRPEENTGCGLSFNSLVHTAASRLDSGPASFGPENE